MNRFALLCGAALVVGCGEPQDQAMQEEASMEEAPTPTITLADVAGTWSLRAMPEMGDSTLVTIELVARADPAGWTVTLPDREPIAAQVVSVSGDSVVVDFGPYESALRSGVMVSTRTVTRLDNGRMVGTFVARYETTSPDSVLRGRLEGTRAQ